jgi:hypothetical protein
MIAEFHIEALKLMTLGGVGDLASIAVGFVITGAVIMAGGALSFFVSFEKE